MRKRRGKNNLSKISSRKWKCVSLNRTSGRLFFCFAVAVIKALSSGRGQSPFQTSIRAWLSSGRWGWYENRDQGVIPQMVLGFDSVEIHWNTLRFWVTWFLFRKITSAAVGLGGCDIRWEHKVLVGAWNDEDILKLSSEDGVKGSVGRTMASASSGTC